MKARLIATSPRVHPLMESLRKFRGEMSIVAYTRELQKAPSIMSKCGVHGVQVLTQGKARRRATVRG